MTVTWPHCKEHGRSFRDCNPQHHDAGGDLQRALAGDRPWDPAAELRTARQWGEFLAWVQAEPPPLRDDEDLVAPRGFDLTWESTTGRFEIRVWHRSNEEHPLHADAGGLTAGVGFRADTWPDLVHQAVRFTREVAPRSAP